MNKIKKLEGHELDLLNGQNGFSIETKFLGRRKVWKVNRFTLGLMDMQSRLYHKLHIEPEFYDNSGNISELIGKAVKENAKICAEIIAISVLGSKWKIFFFKKVLKKHFYWQVDSKKLLEFTNNLFVANNYKDFMTSIALMSVRTITSPATVKADPIEESKAPTE